MIRLRVAAINVSGRRTNLIHVINKVNENPHAAEWAGAHCSFRSVMTVGAGVTRTPVTTSFPLARWAARGTR